MPNKHDAAKELALIDYIDSHTFTDTEQYTDNLLLTDTNDKDGHMDDLDIIWTIYSLLAQLSKIPFDQQSNMRPESFLIITTGNASELPETKLASNPDQNTKNLKYLPIDAPEFKSLISIYGSPDSLKQRRENIKKQMAKDFSPSEKTQLKKPLTAMFESSHGMRLIPGKHNPANTIGILCNVFQSLIKKAPACNNEDQTLKPFFGGLKAIFKRESLTLQSERAPAAYLLRNVEQLLAATDLSANPEKAKKLIKKILIERLETYIEQRKADSAEYFHFWQGLFGGHSKTLKIEAASKLKNFLTGQAPSTSLTNSERQALSQGELSRVWPLLQQLTKLDSQTQQFLNSESPAPRLQ